MSSADTATTRFSPIEQTRRCVACQSEEPMEADYCSRCGFPISPEAALSLPGQPRSEAPFAEVRRLLPADYHVTGLLEERSGIQRFTARRGSRDPGSADSNGEPVLLHLGAASRMKPPVDSQSPADENQVSTVEISFDPGALDPLDLLKSLLQESNCPQLPRLLADIEKDGQRLLITTAAIGMPLLKAWSSAQFDETLKSMWLEQIRSALIHIHERFLLFPTLQPSRLVVGSDGSLRVRDLTGIIPLVSPQVESSSATLYTAPELLSENFRADFRSDAYSFGATVSALLLRRELTRHDFESPGQPRSFAEMLPDAMPPLLRLLGKTFVKDPSQRFPTIEGRNLDASGFQEIGEALSRCHRALRAVRYDIAGWSSIGIQRSSNEDSFSVEHVRAGLGEFQREIALICVADGMGGMPAVRSPVDLPSPR